ncbi:MAG: hypothetical protein WBA31_04485 [Candidatus Dormiibacterota bacterium]
MIRSLLTSFGAQLESVRRWPGCRFWLCLLSAALLLSACGANPATAPGAAPQASPGTGCQLTVTITATAGTVWGTVSATESGTTYTFAGASRTITVPCGVRVELRERPTDSTDWPFHAWKMGSRVVHATSTSTIVTAAVQVSAIFVAAPGTTVSPAASPSDN